MTSAFNDALRIARGIRIVVFAQAAELSRVCPRLVAARAVILPYTSRPSPLDPSPSQGETPLSSNSHSKSHSNNDEAGDKYMGAEPSASDKHDKPTVPRTSTFPFVPSERYSAIKAVSRESLNREVADQCGQRSLDESENMQDAKVLKEALEETIVIEEDAAHAVRQTYTLRERSVPESPLSRAAAFGGLGAGLLLGAAAESARRFVGISTAPEQSTNVYSAFITNSNAERIASAFSRMRGAALKLGQMLSIQDDEVIPAPVLQALERVRQGADVMPTWQLERVLRRELGEGWRQRVVSFDEKPIAAASIGQVHRAIIKDGEKEAQVVFKVQYPGVSRSIKSDLSNLKRLVTVSNLIPENFYIDQALAVAEEELKRECDYSIELENQKKYRELVLGHKLLKERFYVPRVFPELSTKQVLVSEFVKGVPVDRMESSSQMVRDDIGNDLLRLSMTELFVFGFQQSDPNWSNYLYDEESGKIMLIDFGAARPYDEDFLMKYLALICACAARDRDGVIQSSVKLGFLTGEETKEMISAHVQASFAVGEPFQLQNQDGYDFEKSDIPARAAKFGKVMLQHRLTPPPKEAYSLHRRLSGAFLMSTKLRARVNAYSMLEDTVGTLISEGRLDR